MSEEQPSNFFFKDHFKSNETAKQYELTTGGVTRTVTRRVISLYLEDNSLEGKVILDNACGTGVVTKEILSRTDNVTIEAADYSEAMIDALKESLSASDKGKCVNVKVMDGSDLTYPDNTFDLSITLMGIMFFPDADKALYHLHRVTKPGGKCYITTWYRMQHKEIALAVVKRLRGPNATLDLVSPFWKVQMEDPAYLPSALGNAGFTHTGGETKLVNIEYKGEEGITFGIENMPKLYAKMMKFEEGEEEKWNQLWEEELRKECISEDGMRLKMWANIGWGTK